MGELDFLTVGMVLEMQIEKRRDNKELEEREENQISEEQQQSFFDNFG